jgi:hypothetical protein
MFCHTHISLIALPCFRNPVSANDKVARDRFADEELPPLLVALLFEEFNSIDRVVELPTMLQILRFLEILSELIRSHVNFVAAQDYARCS